MEKLKIAWLWLVRENQPISVQELVDKLESKQIKLPVAIQEFEYSTRLSHSGLIAIEGLLKDGLVVIDDPKQRFRYDVKVKCSPALYRMQDIFSVSLTKSLRQSDNAVTIEPSFGKPVPKAKDEKWARIFVAMPFQAELKPIYTDHILKVANALGVSCKRGDDFFTTNSIINDVWSAIYNADICIVDCTGRNPNVFYELGIAHTLGRKTVLIAQNMQDIPFDVKHWRIIEYKYTPPGMEEFEQALTATLKTELVI